MAEKTIFIDDIDNSVTEDVRTVIIAHDDDIYSIDLGPANRAKLAKALEPFISHATKTFNKKTGAKKRGSSVPSKEIRTWANANGHEVSPRGVIHKDVIAAYNAANGTNY